MIADCNGFVIRYEMIRLLILMPQSGIMNLRLGLSNILILYLYCGLRLWLF